MISDRAKRLVESLQSWRSLEAAYQIAQDALDQERDETWVRCMKFNRDQTALEDVEDAADCAATRARWAATQSQGDAGGYQGFVSLAEKIAQTRGHDVSPTEGE